MRHPCVWCDTDLVRDGAVWLCPTPACQQRQYACGIRSQEKHRARWLYVPLPTQVEFHLAQAPNVLFGGAAGGSKSHSLRWDAYTRCLSIPGYRALFLRTSFPELESTHIEAAQIEQRDIGAVYQKASYVLRFANDSIIRFGHANDLSSASRYLSTEYDAIYFDELTTFEEKTASLVMSRARSTKPGVAPVIRAGTNPGGIGATWVKRRFIDHDVTEDEDPSYDEREWVYIPSKLDDNPYLDDRYATRLMALPRDLREAYRHGSWDIYPGQYFEEWRKDRHVAETPELPVSTTYFRAIDWGYTAPGVCLWFACPPSGRLHVLAEYVFRRTTTAEVAMEITRRTRELVGKRPIRYTVADPAMWTKEGQTGESMAETMERYGVTMVRGDHDRINGWNRLRHWLTDAPAPADQEAQPWMRVAHACPYLIRTVPTAIMDRHRPEDLDTRGDDHALDALRYGVMSRPWPGKASRSTAYAPNTMGFWRQWMERSQRPRLGAEAVK